MACIDSVVLSCIPKEDCGSQTLQRIARQLQFYKPPKLDREDQKDVGRGPIYAINGTKTAGNEQLSACADWRKRKAAVLICLFEGPQGELRVILTKRSMKLLSYPGMCVTNIFYWDFINPTPFKLHVMAWSKYANKLRKYIRHV